METYKDLSYYKLIESISEKRAIFKIERTRRVDPQREHQNHQDSLAAVERDVELSGEKIF